MTAGLLGSVPAASAAPAVHHAVTASPATAGAAVQPGGPVVLVKVPGAHATMATASKIPTLISTNWAGYVAIDVQSGKPQAFRNVEATFTVPRLDCRRSPRSLNSDWVGLDGFNNDTTVKSETVEQDGIQAACAGRHGTTPSYGAWWEMYPRPETPVRGMRAKPGDKIFVQTYYSAARRKFFMKFVNKTAHRHFSVWKSCNRHTHCTRVSAEVISEAPTLLTASGGMLTRLADFRTIKYSKIGISLAARGSGGMISKHWQTLRIAQAQLNKSQTKIVRLLDWPSKLKLNTFHCTWMHP